MDCVEIRTRLVGAGVASAEQLEGCTHSEIAELENKVGKVLPQSYKEFLLAVGHSAGSFLQGSEFFFKSLNIIDEGVRELLRERCTSNVLPENAFIFYSHQGYEFGFFILGESEDPAIYQYIEGDEQAYLVWKSFTDYLAEMIVMSKC